MELIKSLNWNPSDKDFKLKFILEEDTLKSEFPQYNEKKDKPKKEEAKVIYRPKDSSAVS